MYQGFFINLDRNETRRRSLAKHLEEIGAASRYRRIEAVDGRAVAPHYQTELDPGSLGCWLSHVKTAEANRGAKNHLHIIEDDTIFGRNVVNMFDGLLESADAKLSGWDLIFTDLYLVPGDARTFRELSGRMRQYQQSKTRGLLDLQHASFSAMSSYFVNSQSIDRFIRLVSGRETAGVPIDLYVRGLVNQKLLKAYLTVPFLTSISSDSLQSDIRGEMELSRAVFDTFRRSFFQDADVHELAVEMRKLIEGIAPSPLEMIYLDALLFTLSDRYVHF